MWIMDALLNVDDVYILKMDFTSGVCWSLSASEIQSLKCRSLNTLVSFHKTSWAPTVLWCFEIQDKCCQSRQKVIISLWARPLKRYGCWTWQHISSHCDSFLTGHFFSKIILTRNWRKSLSVLWEMWEYQIYNV